MAIPGAVGLSVVVLIAGGVSATRPDGEGGLRHPCVNESWQIRNGRFFQNDRWVFLKTGKLIRGFDAEGAADKAIADIDVLIGRLNYNHFSLNIYPDAFDADADTQIDAARRGAYEGVGRILDACWDRGVFCSLSFETYNVGGGGTPASLFAKHPETTAINGLGEPAHDVEYAAHGKQIPSIFHPAYLDWSRGFIRNFLHGLGPQRTRRLLYVETTVEPQYLGQCSFGDRDERRAFLDFNPAARDAFEKWQSRQALGSPALQLRWPTNQQDRDRLLGDREFNRFRAEALAGWVNGDIEAIHSVAPEVYIAVDFNGRFDDAHGLRLGDHEAFLAALRDVNVLQIAPHTINPWTSLAWDEASGVNERSGKHWAISEHMTVGGDWHDGPEQIAEVLDETLTRGTRWGWEFVNVSNHRAQDPFSLYEQNWTSPLLDVIEGQHWSEWLNKIGVARFEPKPRAAER